MRRATFSRSAAAAALVCALLVEGCAGWRSAGAARRGPRLAAVRMAGSQERLATWQLSGDLRGGLVESWVGDWANTNFGRDHQGPLCRRLGVPVLLTKVYRNGFEVIAQVSKQPVERCDAVEVLFELYDEEDVGPGAVGSAGILVVERCRRGPAASGALGPQLGSLVRAAEEGLVDALDRDLGAFSKDQGVSARRVKSVDVEQAPLRIADVDADAAEELERAIDAGADAAESAARAKEESEELLDGDLGAASVEAFEAMDATWRKQQERKKEGNAFKAVLDDDSRPAAELEELFALGAAAAAAAAGDEGGGGAFDLGAFGEELRELELLDGASFEASQPEDAAFEGVGYDAEVEYELQGGMDLFAVPAAASEAAPELRPAGESPAILGDAASFAQLSAADGAPASPAGEGLGEAAMRAAADAVGGAAAGPDAPPAALAAAAAARVGRVSVAELIKAWPAAQIAAFRGDCERLGLAVAAAAPLGLDDASMAQVAQEQRSVLLSEWYPLAVRSLLEGGMVRTAEEKETLSRMNGYAIAMAEQLAEVTRAAEQQQLQKIATICQAAQDDMATLPRRVKEMRGLLDAEFLSYLRYAVERERADIARAGMDPDREPSDWLQVLSVIRSGVLAEREIDVRDDVEILQVSMLPNDPRARRHLLNRLVEERVPAEDLPRLRQTARSMADNFRAREAPPELGEAAAGGAEAADGDAVQMTEPDDWTTRVLQLGGDIEEVLPDGRIQALMEASEERMALAPGAEGAEGQGLAAARGGEMAGRRAQSFAGGAYVPPRPKVSAEALLASIEEAKEDDFGGFGDPEEARGGED